MKGFLTVENTPLRVGDVLRSEGAGNRIMQVMLLRRGDAYLVSAGTVTAGVHKMPNRPHVLAGAVVGHQVVTTMGQIYTKVLPRTELPGLLLEMEDPDGAGAGYVNQG